MSFPPRGTWRGRREFNLHGQTAYLMADISDVRTDDLKEILEQLDALNCTCNHPSRALAAGRRSAPTFNANLPGTPLKSKNHDQDPVLVESGLVLPDILDANRMASVAFGWENGWYVGYIQLI